LLYTQEEIALLQTFVVLSQAIKRKKAKHCSVIKRTITNQVEGIRTVVPKHFWTWLESEFGEHLVTKASNSVFMTKITIEWMISGRKFISWFVMSASTLLMK